MSRSAHTFLPKNKLVAGMGIGAIAMLAMAGPALPDNEQGSVQERRSVHSSRPSCKCRAQPTFFSFDISWFDPKLNKYFLADRNNKAIDVVDPQD